MSGAPSLFDSAPVEDQGSCPLIGVGSHLCKQDCPGFVGSVVVCETCKVWQAFPFGELAGWSAEHSDRGHSTYATGEGGRLQVIKRGFTEGAPAQLDLFGVWA